MARGVCFLINGISYVAVLWALLAMNPTLREQAPGRGESVLEGMRAGFRYAWGFEPIRVLLLLLALVSVVGMPYSVLMPIFAKQILGGGPSTLGLLVTASGVGALGGALLLAFRRSVLGLGQADRLCRGAFWPGADRLFPLPLAVAVDGLPGLERIWHDRRAGGEQRRPADDRG